MNVAGARVLLTGATGVVGSELAATLRETVGELVTTSASGHGEAVLRWAMGREPRPAALRGDFDVVIHSAAKTRWSQTQEEARQGNLEAARALPEVVRDKTRLVFLSTAHAIGTTGSAESEDLADYRNAYEWSKAAAERFVRATFPAATIVRFPMVIGRRRDGHVARFSGFYKVLNGFCSGLLPAVVGIESAPVDFVPVDDLAVHIYGAMVDDGRCGDLATIGCGTSAPTVTELLDVVFDTLDSWRAERGIDPLPRPPVLDPSRWDRFFYPFAQQHLSPLQLRSIDLFLEFRAYLSMPQPFETTDQVHDVLPALATSLRYWADANTRSASAVPLPWD